MSDLGLYGSVYEQLRVYADRLDRVLIQMRSDSPEAARQAQRDTAQLLHELADEGSLNPSTRLVALVLRQELPPQTGKGPGLCAMLADTLDQRAPSPGELRQLETIAITLDNECTRTLARIRGKA